MVDPATIARGLSPAQAKALLWLPEDGCVRLLDWGADKEMGNALYELWQMGCVANVVVSAVECGGHGLRSLGLAVRAALQRTEAGDGG
ncbi:hypothetical protein [Roseococcus pinisoli]|uniref:Uncharacterized protein n=1 Tax=Roseococcus pinisoli TaxID=2835040 RepID=A0ABS5Q9W5_9PROT|nr:hypothetical protein [Roseococcus pinisoli]MBS7810501.1 hypothetical protein [Roseococcus pinisoli]